MGRNIKLTDNGELQVFEAIGNGTSAVTIKAGASLAADLDFILPTALPASQEFLTLDASGNITTSPGIDPLVIPNQGSVDLRELTANGTDAVKLQAAASMAADYTVEFAAAAPAADAFVTMDSSGVLTYVRGLPNQGGLDLTELTASGSAVLTLKADSDMTADAGSYTLTFPSGVPGAQSFLQVSTGGVVSYSGIATNTLDAVYSNGQDITADAGPVELQSATGLGKLRFHRVDTTIVADDEYGAVEWEGDDATTSSDGVRARLAVDGTDVDGAVRFDFQGALGGSTSLRSVAVFDVDANEFLFGSMAGSGATCELQVHTLSNTGTGKVRFESADASGGEIEYDHNAETISIKTDVTGLVMDGAQNIQIGSPVASGGSNTIHLGGDVTPDNTGLNTLKIESGSAPTGAAGIASLFTSFTPAELVGQDASSNNTTLTPHSWGRHDPSEKMAWCYRSERGGTEIFCDMAAVIRAVEALSGQSFIEIYHLNRPDPQRPAEKNRPGDGRVDMSTIPGKGPDANDEPIPRPIPDVLGRP